MEKGFLIAGYGIWWQTEKAGFWWTRFGKENLAQDLWRGKVSIPSIRCRDCGIVMFRTKKERPGGQGKKVKCPYCESIYYYFIDKIDENGFITCPICNQSFLLDQDILEAHHEHEQ
jgi:uncharacterized Zn-finger protein